MGGEELPVVDAHRSWRRSSGALAAAGVLLLLAACSGTPPGPSGASSSPSESSSERPTPTCSGADLARWTTPRLAAQLVVAPVRMDDLGAAQAAVRAGVGGLLLLGSPAPADLGPRLAALGEQAPGGVAPIVMADEEGGAVQRLRSIVGPVPSARTMAATMTPDQVESVASTVGHRLLAAGVRMDLAPVLDLDDRPGPSADNPDGTRSFGIDAERTTTYGLAFARGLQRAGVVPVVKHFPGLGGSTGNTDVRAGATRPWSELLTSGLVPFRRAADDGLPAMMVANATVPGLSAQPASVSVDVVSGVLREQLGYDGVVLTDSLSAGALAAAGYDVPRAAVAALRAGGDLVLYGTADSPGPGETFGATVAAIGDAVTTGDVTSARLEQSVARVLAVKGLPVCPSR